MDPEPTSGGDGVSCMRMLFAVLLVAPLLGAAASCASSDELDGAPGAAGGLPDGGGTGGSGADGGGSGGAGMGGVGTGGSGTGGSGTGGSAAQPGDGSAGSGWQDAPVIGIDSPVGNDSGEAGLSCPPPTASCDGDDLNGCETTLDTLGNCGACGVPCDRAHAAESCATGVCTLGTCDSGWEDCNNDDADGCETDTQATATDCGGCAFTCDNQHGSTQCLGGQCAPGCDSGYDDCDGNPDNGCETALNTLSNCGGCNVPCSLPGGESCSSGSCQPTGCPNDFDDCDGQSGNGCEANLLTDSSNCGGCGITCDNPHGTTSCVTGICTPVCDADWDSCDGNNENGCETSLTTLTDCGFCGQPCSVPGGTATCASGSCTLGGCPTGKSNCDGAPENGCEVDHAAAANACGTASDLGAHGGDGSCGFICGSTSWTEFASTTGRTSRWIKGRAKECSSCCTDVQARVTLLSPPDANYDLYVYSSCGNLIGSQTAGAGQSEALAVYVSDDCLNGDSSFDYWVEVRYQSGASCDEWSLTLEGRGCSC